MPESGTVNLLGYDIFYRTYGEHKKGTVICMHGGPGVTHDYLLSIVDLTKRGYEVVFYDQLGVGRSEKPKDIALFTEEHYVEELEALRRKLGLRAVHLIGSSCGGTLAIAYTLKYQRNVKSMVTVGGIHNFRMSADEMERLKRRLPPDVYGTMLKFEKDGDYGNPEYLKAMMVFYKRHLCRLARWPAEVQYTSEHISLPVYNTMHGPSEPTWAGNLRYWDVTDRLHTIRVPSLITCGRYDEVTPKVAKDIHSRIKGSKLMVFPKSSHMPFWEERESFMKVVGDFLDQS